MALALPMNLLGGTIGKPYYAEVAKLGKKAAPEIRTLTVMIIKRLFLISLIPAAVIFFVGPVLFRIVFGENWVLAGEIASVLSIYLVAQFVSSPIVQALNIFGRQSVYLQLNIQRTLLLIIVFGVAAYWQFPILVTILAYSVIMTLHYLFTLFRVVSCIRV
jgi:O-antigen/teichoic acid export membrane protein